MKRNPNEYRSIVGAYIGTKSDVSMSTIDGIPLILKSILIH